MSTVWLDARGVAAVTGYSVGHVRLLARRGEIPARKVGRSVRFMRSELDRWLAQLPKAGQ